MNGSRSVRFADLGCLRRSAADFARLAGRLHQSVVEPVFGLRLAVAAFALGDFVFMMRENQIEPAAVDVECFAQDASAHRRAFDMPARPAFAPWAIP